MTFEQTFDFRRARDIYYKHSYEVCGTHVGRRGTNLFLYFTTIQYITYVSNYTHEPRLRS